VGKTATGLIATVQGHGPEPGALRGAVDGGTIWWVGPTFTITQLIWRLLKTACCGAWVEKSEQDHRIELPGGGSVCVRSADNPDRGSLRGEGLDGLVIDEAAFISKRAWVESLRPALSDKQGWSMMLTTPAGYNWLKEQWDAAAVDDTWARFRLPTSANPLIPQSELDAAYRDMGARAFAQEHEAQFTDVEGAEFDGAYFGDSIWFDQWPPEAEIQWRVITLDPSKGATEKSDYSAFVMMMLDKHGVMWVDADIAKRDTHRIVVDGIRLAREFEPHAFGVETNQFQEMLVKDFERESLKAKVFPNFYGIDNRINKVVRIRGGLTPYLSRGQIRFKRGSPGARLLVEQLRGFPVAKHEDGPDALEMAVRQMRHVFNHGVEDQRAEIGA